MIFVRAISYASTRPDRPLLESVWIIPFPPFSGADRNTTSCPIFFTDFQVEIAYADDSDPTQSSEGSILSESCTAKITRWYQLEDFWSPMDSKWKNLVGSFRFYGRRRVDICEAGEIRQRWEVARPNE